MRSIKLAALLVLAAFFSLTSNSTPLQSKCTAEKRLSAAEAIPNAYNLPELGASSAAFDQIPFAENCLTTIAPDGLPPIPVAINDFTTRTFAKLTRQVFSRVTGINQDFPKNSTSVILTNVTLGVRDIIPIPVTFSAHVYLDFDQECEIEKVRAFAQIPSEVAGIVLSEIRAHEVHTYIGR